MKALFKQHYKGRRHAHAPNLDVYAWYLNERERIRIKREDLKLPAPWTEDEIYRNFKFTNIRRPDDRVSRDLVSSILPGAPDDLKLFNAIVFRTFNCIQGYEASGGWIDYFYPDEMNERLDVVYAKKGIIFGNAYLMVNSMTAGGPKHRMYVSGPFAEIWKDRAKLVRLLQDYPTLEAATKIFTRYAGYADFLGYELALDMQMLGLLKPLDSFYWANPGPGARRGLNYVYDRPKNFTQPTAKFLDEMRWLWDESVWFLEPHVREPFDMRCVENGLCETSKYASVLLTGRAKRRFRNG